MFSSGRPPELNTSHVLAALLDRAGITPAGLARRTHTSPGEVSNIRHGRRHGDRRWAAAADTALDGGGQLTAAWDADEDSRRITRLLAASAATAAGLLAEPDAGTADAIHAQIAALGIQYLHQRAPGGPLLSSAQELQRELARRLRCRAYADRELRELQAAAGRVSGIIAYAALDLGDAASAETNAGAAFRLGERAGMSELQAWARGTQSLIARFSRDYARAGELASDGLRYAGKRSGTAGLRLLAGAAQCRANLGDRDGALRLLDAAAAQRMQYHPRDELTGLFAFSEAKQMYYGGSSLMWLNDRAALQRAVRDSAGAVTLWDEGPDATRSAADQALASVYLATAHARLGHPGAAMAAVAPVLELPGPQRISWLRRRMGELAGILASGRHASSAATAADAGMLRAWARDSTA